MNSLSCAFGATPLPVGGSLVLAVLTGLAMPAQAISLSAVTGGTFTFNYDHAAMAEYVNGAAQNGVGLYLSRFWNSAESDYLTRSRAALQSENDFSPDTASAFTHDVTPTSPSNPAGQAAERFVKSTTPNFAVDSVTLSGIGTLGMTGVQAYRLPLYEDGSTHLFFGDFALRYNPSLRQSVWSEAGLSGAPSGWYLTNHFSLTAVAYDLANLQVNATDGNNWKMSGDLLMAPENAVFLLGPALKDMGNFCLGVGSFAGCSQPVAVSGSVQVPVDPMALGALAVGLAGLGRRQGNRRCHFSA